MRWGKPLRWLSLIFFCPFTCNIFWFSETCPRMRFDFFSGYIKALIEFEYYIIQVMIWKMERKRSDLYDPFWRFPQSLLFSPHTTFILEIFIYHGIASGRRKSESNWKDLTFKYFILSDVLFNFLSSWITGMKIQSSWHSNPLLILSNQTTILTYSIKGT